MDGMYQLEYIQLLHMCIIEDVHIETIDDDYLGRYLNIPLYLVPQPIITL